MSGDWAVLADVRSFQSLNVSFSLFKVSTTIESLELISFRHSLVVGSSSTFSVEIVGFPFFSKVFFVCDISSLV